jgi:diaminopimelate decarboxylase
MVCEDVNLADLAEAQGTPAYVYSTATLERHFQVLRDSFKRTRPLIAYAVKANPNMAVISVLARQGAGADTVSRGEIERALRAGVPPDRIVFSGVGKTDAELAFAVEAQLLQVNVESEPEMRRLEALAQDQRRIVRIAVRVNPDVGAGGHDKISTGREDAKFGVSLSEAERLYQAASDSAWLDPVGLACHIGSQITDLAPLRDAYTRLGALTLRLRSAGLAVHRLDLGGGLGVPYFDAPAPPSPAAFAAMAEAVVADLDVELTFEPGRLLVANAGVLISRVIHVHERPEGRRFLVLDAGMNDLLRPALYEAFHDIRPIRRQGGEQPERAYDVVGPVCETSDTFARDRKLPPLGSGDLVALMTAGAYGSAMASEYNSRPLVPEILVDGPRYAVVRPRPSLQEMLDRERAPSWIHPGSPVEASPRG